MPFTVRKYGIEHEIYSLLDPHLDLFLGISEFEAVVEGGTIPNNTKERYVGGRECLDHGPCFIGLLCDIVDEEGNSIKDKVYQYTFSQIKIANVEDGTKVKITHFRIPSHYEMNGLVQLQRIRKRLVDSIYFRMHGRRRESGE